MSNNVAFAEVDDSVLGSRTASASWIASIVLSCRNQGRKGFACLVSWDVIANNLTKLVAGMAAGV